MVKRILGLDISTKTIGISVLDYNKKVELVYVDFYKPIKNTIEDKNKDFLNLLLNAKKHILSIIEKYKPTHIAVEDYIRFMKGGSGSSTIIPLCILNRTICLSIVEKYPEIELSICNIISIRTKIKKNCGLTSFPPKEEIPKLLEKLLNIKIPRPTKITKKSTKILEEHFDMADAIAVGYYCLKLNTI